MGTVSETEKRKLETEVFTERLMACIALIGGNYFALTVLVILSFDGFKLALLLIIAIAVLLIVIGVGLLVAANKVRKRLKVIEEKAEKERLAQEEKRNKEEYDRFIKNLKL
jgi:uncharacterized membrane protein